MSAKSTAAAAVDRQLRLWSSDALGWMLGYMRRLDRRVLRFKREPERSDFIALGGVGARLRRASWDSALTCISVLTPYSNPVAPSVCALSHQDLHLLLPIILGVPWVLMAQLAAENRISSD